mmetsp:Transcript_12566/g.35498  ORF Transcript_12566/g.35498 Transcript_12566/m.35498 type:complete len:234 (-) Transcript_12566:131-832(-)
MEPISLRATPPLCATSTSSSSWTSTRPLPNSSTSALRWKSLSSWRHITSASVLSRSWKSILFQICTNCPSTTRWPSFTDKTLHQVVPLVIGHPVASQRPPSPHLILSFHSPHRPSPNYLFFRPRPRACGLCPQRCASVARKNAYLGLVYLEERRRQAGVPLNHGRSSADPHLRTHSDHEEGERQCLLERLFAVGLTPGEGTVRSGEGPGQGAPVYIQGLPQVRGPARGRGAGA